MGIIDIIICRGCDDLVDYKNCTYDEAMSFLCEDEPFHIVNGISVHYSKKKECYGCRPDEIYRGF
mgnify:CR=1 FL=1